MSSPRSWTNPLRACFFYVICVFCVHHALEKIHTWHKLFAYGKIFARGIIKSRRKALVKIEKNTSLKNKEREPLCQEKKKIFRESNWYWRSFTLASGFRTQRSQKFVMHKVKNEVSFYLCNSSLDTITLAIA